MKEEIICPNCGAPIEKDSVKCPYCGYINEEGAEKKFQEDLSEIKEDIEEKKKEPSKALLKGFAGGGKTVLITVVILVILAIIFFVELLRETKDKPKLFPTVEEQEYASAYAEVAGKEIAEAYDNKDIARMAEIYDKAYSEDRVDLYGIPHYDTARASSFYMKLQQCISKLDNNEMSGKVAEELTYYCFYFYFMAYGDDGAEIFDPIREAEIIPIITERLGFTVDDMEGFREKVVDPPHVNRSRVYKVTKKYYKNYH